MHERTPQNRQFPPRNMRQPTATAAWRRKKARSRLLQPLHFRDRAAGMKKTEWNSVIGCKPQLERETPCGASEGTCELHILSQHRACPSRPLRRPSGGYLSLTEVCGLLSHFPTPMLGTAVTILPTPSVLFSRFSSPRSSAQPSTPFPRYSFKETDESNEIPKLPEQACSISISEGSSRIHRLSHNREDQLEADVLQSEREALERMRDQEFCPFSSVQEEPAALFSDPFTRENLFKTTGMMFNSLMKSSGCSNSLVANPVQVLLLSETFDDSLLNIRGSRFPKFKPKRRTLLDLSSLRSCFDGNVTQSNNVNSPPPDPRKAKNQANGATIVHLNDIIGTGGVSHVLSSDDVRFVIKLQVGLSIRFMTVIGIIDEGIPSIST